MIKWGIIGLGKMANTFANAIKEVDNACLVAIASKNNSKLESFGTEFNLEKNLRFIDYESLAKCKDVDAVYISTLNNTHANLIALCASNKKNILCEKPFCVNFNEAENIKKIIEYNNVKFFEAIAYLSHPQTNEIFDLINNNEIGEINSIKSQFGFKVKKVDPKSRLFNKKLGGGVILDVGCYPISFISLFGKKNKHIKFDEIFVKHSNFDVDVVASASITIDKKILCEIKISLEEELENTSIIYGSHGHIVVKQPWLPGKKTFLEIFNKGSYYKKFISSELSIYATQVENISNQYSHKNIKKTKLFDVYNSLENMKLLDQWKNQKLN